MSDSLAKIEALVPDFQYVDSDHNRIVLTVGFSASFYFWGGHTPENGRLSSSALKPLRPPTGVN
jgi:hypothetical protein